MTSQLDFKPIKCMDSCRPLYRCLGVVIRRFKAGEATNLDACERPRDCDDEQSESGSCGQFEGDSGGKDGKDSVANTATVGDPGNEGDVSIVEPGDALQPKSQEDDDDDEEEEGEVGMADGAGDGDEEAWEETVAVTSGNDVEDEDDGDEEITDTA